MLLIMLSLLAAEAQSCVAEPRPLIAHTAPSPAKIADLSWLEGAWEGDGLDRARATEVYSAPADDQIVGHFRQLRSDGSIWFYEIITIASVSGSLEYRLKHFNADLSGWEEKAQVRVFRLVRALPDSWHFEGLTVRRIGAERMNVEVCIQGKEGPSLEVFRYKRINP